MKSYPMPTGNFAGAEGSNQVMDYENACITARERTRVQNI